MKEKYKVAPDWIDAIIWTTKRAINSDDEERKNTENTWITTDKRIESYSESSSATIRKIGCCECATAAQKHM